MVEESSPVLRPAEESIEAETDTALEPKSGQPALEPAGKAGFVCDCEEWVRSACEGLPFYKEHESRRYCVFHYPGKEKSADFKAALDSKLNKGVFDFQGVWFPDEVNFGGLEFSADAGFSSATFSADADFRGATFNAKARFSNATFSAAADFEGATFSAMAAFFSARFSSDADFSSAKFGAGAYFIEATFSSNANFFFATFGGAADFSEATFAAVDFGNATFMANVDFSEATFAAADFGEATFRANADFSDAMFSTKAEFSSATFSADASFNLSVFQAQADFSRATFNDSIHFFGSATERPLKDGASLAARALGEDPSLDLQHVRIEHPGRIAFHTLNLRPHWFVNVDPRQFVFTDVGWEWKRLSIKEEIAALECNQVSSPNRLLAIACRQLAENAEANNRYEEASRFRYWAMDLARRTKWKGWSFWKTDWLHLLYWAVSGYGEKIVRALGVLVAVWIAFMLLYTRVGFVQQPLQSANDGASAVNAESVKAPMTIEDKTGRPLEFSRALTSASR